MAALEAKLDEAVQIRSLLAQNTQVRRLVANPSANNPWWL